MCFYLSMDFLLLAYFMCDHIPENLQQIPTVMGYDCPIK